MKIDLEEVAKKYNALDVIWEDGDKWHLRTKKMISEFIKSSFEKLPNNETFKILNAGSAGYSYGLKEDNILHVDIAKKHISHLPNSIVVNVEELPLPDKYFDLIICVGSVLNYCDPIKVIEQFARVLKKEGYIILEFENSHSFELLFKRGFNCSAVFVETFFNEKEKERLWYFSETYITRLLGSYGLKALAKRRCHIISPLIYRITKSQKVARWFGKFDCACYYIPVINKFCSNVIYLFKHNIKN